MYGKIAATAQPNSIAPDTQAAPAAAPAGPPPARPYGVAGELTAELIREWGPVLKPTGIGLLVALHSFEETSPGHPFYGWAHCTQNALAAYLDTSQDTIARYSNLLQTCGLLQVEEVETPRGKQKLYRVARGQAWPSLGLLEHLVFDADPWTRKHAAWLAARLAPLGPETEMARLTGIMQRAYRVEIDGRGLAGIVEGARLTRQGSFRPLREPSAQQPPLLPAGAPSSAPGGSPAGRDLIAAEVPLLDAGLSASCGHGPAAPPAAPAPTGDPSAPRGGGPQGQPGATGPVGVESAPSGGRPEDGWDKDPIRESAPCGLPGPLTEGDVPPLGRESARGGFESVVESARGGVAGGPIVNVESLNAKNEKNGNDNDAAPTPSGHLAAGSGVDPNALIGWGVGALGDLASREWHRRCLNENGPERYRWAIEATQRARAKGSVSNPGAYFTSLLRRRGGPPLSPPAVPDGAAAAPLPPVPPAADPPGGDSPVAGVPLSATAPRPASATSLSEGDCARTWQAALVHLRIILPADEYSRILRYAVLLELDRAAGWALLGLPTDYMREQVARRLAGTIAQVLGQVSGTPLHVAAAVLPGQGRLGGAMPTLGEWLAARAQPPAPG